MLRKEFFRDAKIAQLPFGGRLLFQSLWIHADDFGNTVHDARLIRSEAFPMDEVALTDVETWLAQMIGLDMLDLYEEKSQKYLHITNFLRHQKIDRPSPAVCPPFSPRMLVENSTSDQRAFVPQVKLSQSEKNSSKGEMESEVKGERETEGTATPKATNVLLMNDFKTLTKPNADGSDKSNGKAMSVGRRCAFECNAREFLGINFDAVPSEHVEFLSYQAGVVLARYCATRPHGPAEECSCSQKTVFEMIIGAYEKAKQKWPPCLLKLKKAANW